MIEYKKRINSLRLIKEPTIHPAGKITSSVDASDYARKLWDDSLEIFESMYLILMNRANNTTDFVKISQGGVTGTVCDPKLVAKYSVDALACSVILIHNHPSGNLKPSAADEKLTQKIKSGLELLDIYLADHIILTTDNYFSFADEGLI